MNNIDDVYEYRYMDETLKKIREQSLKDYLTKEEKKLEEKKLLKFVDLDIYLKPHAFSDLMLSEINRSVLDNQIVLNRYQIEILDILSNHNLFLSAPTSFGKTYVMLEFIKRNVNKLNNIIFIIPTIALMNELLKKIYNYFSDEYNICTNSGEEIAGKNIFIFVPERSDIDFLNKTSKLNIDLLIFDEIYKLQPASTKELKSDDRIIYMNKVYLDLVNKSKKIALLGPFINDVKFEKTKLDIVKYFTNYMPVYNKLLIVPEEKNWKNYIKLSHQLIYFKTPESIYNNIKKLLDLIPTSEEMISKYSKEIKYLEEIVGREWYVVELLKRGIGIHHGKTPMFLRKFYENEYNNGNLKILLCTNTLMEGINTPTDSLIVVDSPGSAFKLNNLMGRVGRLNIVNPVIGEIVISNNEILDNIKNTNDWLTLQILAENNEANIDDEIVYLNKEYKNISKQEKINKKIDRMENEYGIDKNTIIEKNLEFNKVYQMFDSKIKEKITPSSSILDIVKTCLKIIPGPAYAFDVKKFKQLNYFYEYLPYKSYLLNLLNKKSMKQIINEFNQSYNIDHNVENINIFIDSLYVLNNFIKFKFSKIIDYLDLLNIEKFNELNIFIDLVSTYKILETSCKILDDLGINEDDSAKILELLNISNVISSSKMIRQIKNNKTLLINSNLNLNPFTINNIKNM